MSIRRMHSYRVTCIDPSQLDAYNNPRRTVIGIKAPDEYEAQKNAALVTGKQPIAAERIERTA